MTKLHFRQQAKEKFLNSRFWNKVNRLREKVRGSRTKRAAADTEDSDYDFEQEAIEVVDDFEVEVDVPVCTVNILDSLDLWMPTKEEREAEKEAQRLARAETVALLQSIIIPPEDDNEVCDTGREATMETASAPKTWFTAWTGTLSKMGTQMFNQGSIEPQPLLQSIQKQSDDSKMSSIINIKLLAHPDLSNADTYTSYNFRPSVLTWGTIPRSIPTDYDDLSSLLSSLNPSSSGSTSPFEVSKGVDGETAKRASCGSVDAPDASKGFITVRAGAIRADSDYHCCAPWGKPHGNVEPAPLSSPSPPPLPPRPAKVVKAPKKTSVAKVTGLKIEPKIHYRRSKLNDYSFATMYGYERLRKLVNECVITMSCMSEYRETNGYIPDELHELFYEDFEIIVRLATKPIPTFTRYNVFRTYGKARNIAKWYRDVMDEIWERHGYPFNTQPKDRYSYFFTLQALKKEEEAYFLKESEVQEMIEKVYEVVPDAFDCMLGFPEIHVLEQMIEKKGRNIPTVKKSLIDKVDAANIKLETMLENKKIHPDHRYSAITALKDSHKVLSWYRKIESVQTQFADPCKIKVIV